MSVTAAAASTFRVPAGTSSLARARASIPLISKPSAELSNWFFFANVWLRRSPYDRILGCAVACRKLSIAGAGMSPPPLQPNSLPSAYDGDSSNLNDVLPAVAASKSVNKTSVDDRNLSAVPVVLGPTQTSPLPPRRKPRINTSVVAAGDSFSTVDQDAAASPSALCDPGASASPAAAGIAGSDAKPRHARRRTAHLKGTTSASAAPTTSPLLAGVYNSDDKARGSTARQQPRRFRGTDGGGGRGGGGGNGLIGAAATAANAQQPGGDGVPPAAAAPSPVVTFSSKVPRAPSWSGVRHWVVFSDLHVRESSLETCLEVLRAVHREARRRNAGVIFLGDFWDRRGALPVEPLNQVLQEMSSWSCPVLMLVGNHDQVDLGGLQHGLTPLELACPHVHVFDEPTLWHGALWLPYRREVRVIERAIAQAAVALGAAVVPGGEGQAAEAPLNAIFLHADVRTARSNQWRQAEEGLEPGAFPPHLLVYSGHYHLPHTVRGTNITYVGSPYQVSMSEASESKRLLILEAPSWSVVDEIPLAIGPRHVRLNGPAACDQLRQFAEAAVATVTAAVSDAAPCHDGGGESSDAADLLPGPNAIPAPAPALRQGDRVKLWLSAAEAQDERVVRAMGDLERAGVSVEQVLQPEVRPARVQAAEGMSADQMIDLYCSGGGSGGEGLSLEAEALVREALAQAREDEGEGGDGNGPMGRCVELELGSVRLRGFGPFVDEQTYPLAARGVRVIVGENQDEPGADSNGAGKTSLVTAPLWALTGDVLSRTESGGGGRVPVDVMRNDLCGSCMVALTGRLNGVAFEVVREVKRGKTSSLTLRLGDEDLTLQDISGTAERIRRLFATDLMRCAAFFGQNDITGLLEANDAMLKQKLGLVVDLEIWEVARQLLAGPRKAAAAAAAEEAGRARVLAQQRARRTEEVEELRRMEAEWAGERERRLEEQRAVLADRVTQAVAAAAELEPRALAAGRLASELRRAANAAEEELRRWEAELKAQRAARQEADLTATSPRLQSPPPMSSLPQQREQQRVQQQQQQNVQTQSDATLQQVASDCQQEQEAMQVLRARQADEARMQQALLERQSAAAQALGRLQQLEGSLREYQTAVATAAAATKRPSAAAAATSDVIADWGPRDGTEFPLAGHMALLQRRRGGSGEKGHEGDLSYSHRGTAGGHYMEGRERGGNGRHDEEDSSQVIMAAHPHQHTSAILAVCDRCRQPISEEQYAANVERLQGGIEEAKTVYDNAVGEEQEAQTLLAMAASRATEANAVVQELQRRRIELERRAAAEALAAAAVAEREARAEMEAAQRAREAAWRETEALLRVLQTRMAANSAARGDLLAAAADLECVILELDQAAATWASHDIDVHRDAAAAGDMTTVPPPSYNHKTIKYVAHDLDAQDVGVPIDIADGSLDGPAPAAASRAPEELPAIAKEVAVGGRMAVRAVVHGVAVWKEAAAALDAVLREVNPRSGLLDRAQRELADLEQQVAQAEAARAAADVHLAALNDADRALGRTGIPSLILEGVLAQLQAYTARFLNELCDGFVLELSATKPSAGGAGGGGSSGRRSGGGASKDKEEIHKAVKVRNPVDGSLRQRDVRQLSGGERRRTALAMCLGFEELVRRRRRLVCNVMVLDEVLQQLDNTGCELVAQVLRDLPHESVLVVGQTNSSVTSNFDLTDVVVKHGGVSYVRVAA